MVKNEAWISTYISSAKKDIVNNNDNYSFNVLPFYFEWKGKRGEINRIEIKNDGKRYDGDTKFEKNFQKYYECAPNETQTNFWAGKHISIIFSEEVARAEIVGKTLIIDGQHALGFSNTLVISKFKLTGIEDWNQLENNKLILKIKERGMVNRKISFCPKITSFIINFGNNKAKMAEYKANLQVGKYYQFNGDSLENTKFLLGKKLDINNSADDIPKICEFRIEIITHGKPISHSELTIDKKNQLKNLFQKNKIKRVVFQDRGLFIEYNNNKNKFLEKNEIEFSQWKDFNQEYNRKEISWETLNDYNPKSNQNNLGTILIVGASLITFIGLIAYFLTHKKKKLN